jgi:carbonic anhydrase
MATSWISPDGALKLLREGCERFAAHTSIHPNRDQNRRTDTSLGGQHPYATILACSDSRVPVEVICDAGIGDIFVVRVAGNVIGPSQLGSIEYAIEHFSVPVFVVMAHSDCGAVASVIRKGILPGNISSLSQKMHRAVLQVRNSWPNLTNNQLVDAVAKQNMWNAIEDSFKLSSIIRYKIKDGSLKVVGAYYDIESGIVAWMGSHPQQENLTH